MGGDTIDFGAAAALLVVEPAVVAEACQHDAVLDSSGLLPVPRQPGDGADGRRDEQKAIAVPPLARQQLPGEEDRYGQTREIVIRQRRMADVTRDQDLVAAFAGQEALAVAE